ncbi:MAG: transcription termination/antitermination protein NusA [Bacteroidaceae bacterium]|nr:transcription termination/antitermination protein NusA [Bacteroidaceae bacterium]MBQ8675969.1 transcription termination/antitermination protein NusA [Bacteroidaceae bacterium]MBQ9175848.1 transcription termination/antitermination protein NusA [Bacteroidaceae bacterium]MBR1379197.1 transcription termination/antitermination protein NusA [Bacteroidaceae bacterium]
MATKTVEKKVSLKDTFKDFKDTKNIDRTTLISVIEDSFHSVLQKQYGSDENFDVIVNPENGDFEIYRNREVVPDDEVENENTQISLSEAQKIDEDYEVGEDVSEKINFSDFGRRAILNLRQTMASKILELEHDNLYHKYKDKVGQIVSGEVYQVWKRETLILDDEGNEMLLPKTEQIPSDFFRKGEPARAVVLRVDNQTGNPKIILSRIAPEFLLRLLEQEVPEISDGLITVHQIARIPGERAKVAVESYNDRIDPVGACVGVKGSRIHGIVRELHNESIDVINYTANSKLLIQRALAPAHVNSITLHEEERKAEVYLNPDQVSLAIGKNGMNIKLASMLTNYTIDVFRELDDNEKNLDDIYLDEFKDEIEGWIIEAIKKIGLDTARAVLEAPREMLIEKADLEEDTVDEVLRILKSEFEDE